MAKADMAKARNEKNDEFYTQLTDIEKELKHYKDHFDDKVVFLNCDDPEYSNFWKYFAMNFNRLKIKKLIATHYANGKDTTYQLIIDRDDAASMEVNEFNYPIGMKSELSGDGDFRSDECIEILKEADIVCTNPPFSLFREYIVQLMEYDKQFLIIGNQNAITYKEIFPLIKNDLLWLGYNAGNMSFIVPTRDEYIKDGKRFWIDEQGHYWRSLGNIVWFTNIEHTKRHDPLLLHKSYNSAIYPTYDNYDAIDVSKVIDIPIDYDGCMGVPITFLTKYNPDQFEIVKFRKGHDERDLSVNGKCPYFRILIQKRKG